MKPENVLVGRTERLKENVLHVVDFGLAKPFIDSETKKHIAYAERRSIIGTNNLVQQFFFSSKRPKSSLWMFLID